MPDAIWNVKKVNDCSIILSDPDGFYSAIVKDDGCVDLRRYLEDDFDYMHICDVDDMIARLQELKRISKAHFVVWPI